MNRFFLAAVLAATCLPAMARAEPPTTAASAVPGALGPAPETPVGAPPSHPISYALIVGSNAGGPGQHALRFAESDAQRVSEVLTTLGGYDAEHVTRLLQPSGAELFGTLEQLEAKLAAHANAGEATRFFFYYSGHARADALNVGVERVALGELRKRILELPATLSIVVLDACQSGSFARAKGVGKAEDFSFNSVGQLSTEGVAVMASSTGQELSQESDELQSGHFTHHLLVALRGAGDINQDGAVTLSEAYEYAYGRTLSSTATTRVGEQHVTLETNLTGHGDVALTRPVDASARVIVPKALTGRVLLQHLPSHSVAAELDKTQGETVALALPPGRYAATVRLSSHALLCPLVLDAGVSTELSLVGCKRTELAAGVAKGGGGSALPLGAPAEGRRAPLADQWAVAKGDPGDEGWFLELAFGASRYVEDDAYEQRLDDFGFNRQPGGGIDAEIAIGRRLVPHLAVGLGYFDLDAKSYEYSIDNAQTFELDSSGGWLFAQGDWFIGDGRLLDVFARAGIGYGVAQTVFMARPLLPEDYQADDIVSTSYEEVEESYSGAMFVASIGAQLNVTKWLGVQLHGRYVYAPILDNELGETHDLGGLALMAGIRFRTWESP